MIIVQKAKLTVFVLRETKILEQKKANETLTMEDVSSFLQGILKFCDKHEKAFIKAQIQTMLKAKGIEFKVEDEPEKLEIPVEISPMPKRWEC